MKKSFWIVNFYHVLNVILLDKMQLYSTVLIYIFWYSFTIADTEKIMKTNKSFQNNFKRNIINKTVK